MLSNLLPSVAFGTRGSQAPTFPICPGRRSHELNACLRSLCAFLGHHAVAPAHGPYVEGVRLRRDSRAAMIDRDRPELRPYSSLCADRLKLLGTASFWPVPFLQPNLILPFLEPKALRCYDIARKSHASPTLESVLIRVRSLFACVANGPSSDS